ncbi:MAG: AsmA family protein, partial [Gammaproteobacteria bacterium]|nr:AsmA family protein [Gammaproteobacteria bacterium]
MTVFGRSIKLFLIFLVLLVIALTVFVATFDANNYKPQIIEQVEKSTGRDFTIDGDINLSIFPWIGLKVEDAALGNEKGFSAKQFATIKQLDIKINALPLLKKEVEINTIRLHGLDVSLEVAKDKTNNWSTIAQPEAEAGATTEAVETTQTGDKPGAEENDASPLQSLKIEGFEFVDAVIRYDDRSSNTTATISEMNLTSSAIAFDAPVDIKFGARIENNQPVIDTRLKMTTRLTFNKAVTVFNLRDFVFTMLTDANDFIAQQERVEIKSDIKISMDDQRITFKSLQLSALGTVTQADVTVTQFLQTPFIVADIAVQPFDARAVAKRVAVQLPEMAKADTLQHVAIKTNIEQQGEKLQANNFRLKMDGSTLSGWLHLDNISKQQLRYELAFDHLNINDYLPAASEPVTQENAVAGAV